jgi:two-component system, chemotaxis family, chemotaxis protein CheY
VRILVVEDDFAGRQFLIRWLKPFGEVDVAVNGNEALRHFSVALATGEPYGLITLDVMMEEMSGLTALAQMRAVEATYGPDTPRARIIMTTALNDPETVKTAIQGGCDAFLVKPLIKDLLMKKIGELGFAVA